MSIAFPIAVLFSLLSLQYGEAALFGIQPKRTDVSRDGYAAGGWTPKPTTAPDLMRRTKPWYENQVCGVLRGNSEYSDYTYRCQASEKCVWNGYNSWWGCCFNTPVPGCHELQCPAVSSCVEYNQLGQCGKECEQDRKVLKCTNSNSPYCAMAAAITHANFSSYSVPMGLLSHYACETTPYNLLFTMNAVESEPILCAPPWVANPASLRKWSAKNPKIKHTFGDLFSGIVARGAARTTTTSSAHSTNTLSFPKSKPTHTATTTSTGGANALCAPLFGLMAVSLVAMLIAAS